jgi:membrane-bound lytic murein transglycosylase F
MASGRYRFLLLLGLVFLSQCRPSNPGAPAFTTQPQVEMDLEAIQKRGYLQALVDNNSVSYFILKGSPMGYEYELLKRLADHLKVELKIKIITGIEEAIDKLNKGEGDVLAFPLTITTDRQEYVAFTEAHFSTHQVLVQKRPANWRMQPPTVLEKKLIRNPVDLIGKQVHVVKGSSFEQRMRNLSQEVGGPIEIIPDSASAETESLIRKVAHGEIKYTVTDQTLAMVNALYYPNLDINTVVSLPQQIGWAVRLNCPKLLSTINQWMMGVKKSGVYQVIYNKYFNSPRFSLTRISSDYSSLAGKILSPYDRYFKEGALPLEWDWRLLASVAYQESNFDPNVKSWAGAIGLMQVMPETGRYFGVDNLWDPALNIRTGVRFLKFLDNQWAKSINDPQERISFVLASYNVGLTHVLDARNLTRKYGKDPTRWSEVEFYLLKKSDPRYYRDPVAAAGYCRCTGPVEYVKEVLERYEQYKLHIDE